MKTNSKIRMMAVAAVAFVAAACTDTWDEHYGNVDRTVPDKSLLQLVEEAGNLNDFLEVLRATHVFNNNKPTEVTYADLLASDQTFTVWAPVDGSFNVDSLLAECATGVVGDSMCGQHFVQNHIAHYVTNSTDEKSVIMLNGKYLDAKPGVMHGVSYVPGYNVEAAKNGLLHVMDGGLSYLYNVYEGLTTLPDFKEGIGAFLKKYEELELDENASIISGIVDGNIVYSDSVLRRTNILFNTFQPINEEDSNFIMLAPDVQMWDEVYEEAKSYFNYGSVNKADSLRDYYAALAVTRDLVYNRNVGGRHILDSVYSTSYSDYDEERHHIYYKPFEMGGIFSSEFVRDTMACSNGVLYNLQKWPFQPEDIYFYPVKVEAENTNLIMDTKNLSYSPRDIVADSVSNGYLVCNSVNGNWKVEYRLDEVLSGTYDVCVVVLPRSVYNANNRNWRSCKLKASLRYETPEGVEEIEELNDAIINNSRVVDTVKVATFHIPVCSYGQPDAKVFLILESNVGGNETGTYNRDEIYIDFLYFKPTKEE